MMGGYLNSATASANAATQGAQARTQGLLQRKQAYANAYKLDADAEASNLLAGEQMATMRQNQAAAIAAQRVQAASSGFSASSGSMLRGEQSVAEAFEQAIANIGKSAAIQDANAREQAGQLRREGDTALALSNVQGAFYDRVARINRYSALVNLAGDALSTAGNLGLTYNFGNSKK